jgi:hypothetical protein
MLLAERHQLAGWVVGGHFKSHYAGARACATNLDAVRTIPSFAVIHRDVSQSFFCAGYGP